MTSPESVCIRDARPDEYEQICELALEAYKQYAAIMPHWEMYRRHLLLTLDNDHRPVRIVAKQNGEIVGSILLYPANTDVYEDANANSGHPEIRLLAVAPTVRGQGVGRALVDECERRARASGATAIGLHTEDIMEAAVRMYVARGYVRAPETDFSPEPGVQVKGYRRSLVDEAS
jgi:predicted N-acetyltransferase YhbS